MNAVLRNAKLYNEFCNIGLGLDELSLINTLFNQRHQVLIPMQPRFALKLNGITLIESNDYEHLVSLALWTISDIPVFIETKHLLSWTVLPVYDVATVLCRQCRIEVPVKIVNPTYGTCPHCDDEYGLLYQ